MSKIAHFEGNLAQCAASSSIVKGKAVHDEQNSTLWAQNEFIRFSIGLLE